MEVVCNPMSATPRVLCHGRKEAEKLEEILTRIKKGTPLDDFTRMGAVVYVHFKGERNG